MQGIYIGTSGWNYDHWEKIFYPESYPMRTRLEYYTKHFNTVEINSTFHHLLVPRIFENWHRRTPDNFQLSIKAYKYVTHVKWEKDFWRPLNKFSASLVPLKEKLGPILFKFPPGLCFNKETFDRFCTFLEDGQRYAIEAQHPSWSEKEALSTLKQYHIAWCISDKTGKDACTQTITSDFIYIHLHGSPEIHESEYSEDELLGWAQKIKKWNQDTYVYFHNHYMGYAPKNALSLKHLFDKKD